MCWLPRGEPETACGNRNWKNKEANPLPRYATCSLCVGVIGLYTAWVQGIE